MFLKQTAFKPRSSSSSGGSDNTGTAGAPLANNSPPATTGARRSSTEKFAGLQGHKRGSQDESAAARKASFAEQGSAGQGVLGQMWTNFTKK